MLLSDGRSLAEAKAELFKALGHPARVRVLELLAEREHTIGELAELTGLELSHLSQQVAVLRRTGVVDSRRVKSSVVCSLRDPRTSQLLAVARQLLGSNLRASQELLAALDSTTDAIALAAPAPPIPAAVPASSPR
jgi:ArsR family transcriptional regulator